MSARIFPIAVILAAATLAACSLYPEPGASIPEPTATGQPAFQVAPGPFDPRYAPVGLALLRDEALAIYAPDGTLRGTRATIPGADFIYVDGSLADGVDALTVIELAQAPHELIAYVDGVELRRFEGGLTGAVGLTGESVLAFGVGYQQDGLYVTGLYLAAAADLPQALPAAWQRAERPVNARPLRIEILPAGETRLWHTQGPFALGGEIIFQPTLSLYHFKVDENLPSEQTLLDEPIYQPALSLDGAWLAHTAAGLMRATHLRSLETVSFDLLPDMDRGAGEQVFSPDNRLLAWKEAAGSRLGAPPSYRALVRVGSLAGGGTLDLRGNVFPGLNVFDLTPVGWLDGQTLVVELQAAADWSRSVWVVSLPDLSARLVGPGEFVGLLYP